MAGTAGENAYNDIYPKIGDDLNKIYECSNRYYRWIFFVAKLLRDHVCLSISFVYCFDPMNSLFYRLSNRLAIHSRKSQCQ